MQTVPAPLGGHTDAVRVGPHLPVTEAELDRLASELRARREERAAASQRAQAEYDALLARHVQHSPGIHAHPKRIALGLDDEPLDYSPREWSI
jgi:hypothetical protein